MTEKKKASKIKPIMLIKKEDGKNFEIPGGTEGRLYPSSPKGDQTAALVEMDGVYPQKGWSVNDVSTETIFLQEGKFFLETKEEGGHELLPGDMFLVFPGVKYRITGKGKAVVIITPSWEKNNNKIVEE